jgi:formate dehydrogenase beta subunit
MLDALYLMGGLGLVIGAILAFASKIFYVYVDPKILEVEDVLPGANCGGCGLPGCSSNAEAIVAGKASPNSCVAAGDDVTEAIAAIMGVSISAQEPDIARPGCTYGVSDADVKYIYDGLSDCRAAALLGGGMKVCSIGCLGLGSCVKACQFGALAMGPKGLPVVDHNKCTGCGACEKACPKNIINLSSVTRRIMKEYTREDCTTPCQRACPAGIDICEYIRQIGLGDYSKAVQVIKERNPFPTVIGRICPRPCEDECRRNLIDEPVAINFLKRFAADFEKDQGKRILPYKAPDTHRKIAIVGAGVEGLSAAFFSARLGHAVTVYEATAKPGGLLRSAIAQNRLSKNVLDWDVAGVIEMGVEIKTEKTMGKDFTIASLFSEGVETIFLATGGWDSRLARKDTIIAQTPIPDTFLLVDYLRDTQNAKSGIKSQISVKSEVVIAGGGRLALDAARICRQNGASRVTVMFRENKSAITVDGNHLKELADDGITVLFNAGITRVMGEKKTLTQLEYHDAATGKTETLALGTLILASGRYPEMIFVQPEIEAEAGEEEGEERAVLPNYLWEGFPPYKNPAYRDEIGIFSKGDVVTDFNAAIKAIGAGRRAAASIHQALTKTGLALPDNVLTPDSVIQDVDHVENLESFPRQIMPMSNTGSAPEKLPPNGIVELEKGFSPEMAQAEAGRCLQCGLICYERTSTSTGIAKKIPEAVRA